MAVTVCSDRHSDYRTQYAVTVLLPGRDPAPGAASVTPSRDRDRRYPRDYQTREVAGSRSRSEPAGPGPGGKTHPATQDPGHDGR